MKLITYFQTIRSFAIAKSRRVIDSLIRFITNYDRHFIEKEKYRGVAILRVVHYFIRII